MQEKNHILNGNGKKYIYILNFGDYFSRVASRRIRRLGGSAKIVSFNTPLANMKDPAGFILSGSPNGSMRVPVKIVNKDIFGTKLPVMGICLGGQLMARCFGGQYKNLKRRYESGMVQLFVEKRVRLFKGLNKAEQVLMMHEDSITKLGEDFVVAAHTELCPIAAAWHKKMPWYILQFHPESSGECGQKVFENFVRICQPDISKKFKRKRATRQRKRKNDKTSARTKEFLKKLGKAFRKR